MERFSGHLHSVPVPRLSNVPRVIQAQRLSRCLERGQVYQGDSALHSDSTGASQWTVDF